MAMGENLDEMVTAGAGQQGAGNVSDLLDDWKIWIGFGRMAAFDLLMNNADRFGMGSEINLQNIDLTNTQQLAPLDDFINGFLRAVGELKKVRSRFKEEIGAKTVTKEEEKTGKVLLHRIDQML